MLVGDIFNIVKSHASCLPLFQVFMLSEAIDSDMRVLEIF